MPDDRSAGAGGWKTVGPEAGRPGTGFYSYPPAGTFLCIEPARHSLARGRTSGNKMTRERGGCRARPKQPVCARPSLAHNIYVFTSRRRRVSLDTHSCAGLSLSSPNYRLLSLPLSSIYSPPTVYTNYEGCVSDLVHSNGPGGPSVRPAAATTTTVRTSVRRQTAIIIIIFRVLSPRGTTETCETGFTHARPPS